MYNPMYFVPIGVYIHLWLMVVFFGIYSTYWGCFGGFQPCASKWALFWEIYGILIVNIGYGFSVYWISWFWSDLTLG